MTADLDFHRDPTILAELVESLELGVFSVDPGGRIVAWSAGAERLTGLRRPQVEGRPCESFDRPGGGGLGEGRRVLDDPPGSEPRILDGCIRGRGDAWIELRGRIAAVRGASGELRGALGWFREVAGLVVPGPGMLRDEDSAPLPRLHELIGTSAAMREVFRRIRLAAHSDVTTLVAGESGTGKELAARAVHQLSDRARRPFVAVNCSALPESLLESELFGHVAGSFTGAIKDRAGVLESAHGGTLFLDEIGDVSPLVQVKLLRALQEREVRRVGGQGHVPIDVRLICATNRDLHELLQSGEMREDFYYRIRVYEIVMPALRDRLEDIPPLAEHLVQKLNERLHRSVRGMSREALRRLLEHRWPGNVRELRNVLEHAFVNAQGDVIEVWDLPAELRVEESAVGAGSAAGPGATEDRLSAREVAERERILEALDACAWNRTETARRLGVSRVTLWKKIRRYRIDEGVFRRGG